MPTHRCASVLTHVVPQLRVRVVDCPIDDSMNELLGTDLLDEPRQALRRELTVRRVTLGRWRTSAGTTPTNTTTMTADTSAGTATTTGTGTGTPTTAG